MKSIKSLLVSFGLLAAAVMPVALPATVMAQQDPIERGLCSGTELQIGAQCQDPGEATGRLNTIITLVVNIFSLIVGVVAVIMIIVGGLKYITSGGDSGNVSGAKNTILYAIVGLIVVALAQFIVRFVLSQARGQGSGTL
jgi:uncharacterized membrane protein YozB (DUF420 family)